MSSTGTPLPECQTASNKFGDFKPCGCPEGRNLVLCIDGTANQFGVKVGISIYSSIVLVPISISLAQNSNVVELYSRLKKNKHQITYYNSGIGTYVKDSKSWLSWDAWKQSFRHGLDMAIARYAPDLKAPAWLMFLPTFHRSSFKEKVLRAYQWLSENYEEGDRIFLFGEYALHNPWLYRR